MRSPLRTIRVVLFLSSILASSVVHAATPEELQSQLDALRVELEQLRDQQDDFYFEAAERTGSVRSFLPERLSLGGFFETAVTGIDGRDTSFQLASGSNVLGINISAIFTSEFKFVSQFLTALSIPAVNFDNDPNASSVGLPSSRQFRGLSIGAVPAQGYIEYYRDDGFRLLAGLGYVPFGFALQQRELVLFVRRGGPQLMRIQNLVEPLWSGVRASGQFVTASGRFGYDAYTFPHVSRTQMLGVGGRTWWESTEEAVHLGFSTQNGKSGVGSATTLGVDARLRLGSVTVISEWARRFTDAGDPWNIYIEPSISLTSDFLVYTFVDYADSALNRTAELATLPDPFHKVEYGFGVNWLPTAFTRYRAGIVKLDYVGATAVPGGRNRDFSALDLSAAVAF